MHPPTPPDDTEPAPDGPDDDVLGWLDSGLQQAYDDMVDKIGPWSMNNFEAMAEAIVGLRTNLVLRADDIHVSEKLAQMLPSFTAEQLQQVARLFFEDPSFLDTPWLRHAVDLEIAKIGVLRAQRALKRFRSLRPVLAAQSVPEDAREYMREVVHTYLMGFDAACIALCRACFDQLAKAVLLNARVFSEAELRKGRLTSLGLLEHLRRHNLIGDAYEPARRLGDRGNTIMHRGLYEERVLPKLSLDSISDLLVVSVALASKW